MGQRPQQSMVCKVKGHGTLQLKQDVEKALAHRLASGGKLPAATVRAVVEAASPQRTPDPTPSEKQNNTISQTVPRNLPSITLA